MKKIVKKTKLMLCALILGLSPFGVASCSDDDDTLAQQPGMDISQFALGAEGGVSKLMITPTDSWSVKSETSWLKVSPASGTVAEKEIVLTAEANTTFASRTATLKMTVGTTVLTKTIVQEAMVKYISIYSDTITFSRDEDELEVFPIISNVEVQIVEFPSWIESVEVTKKMDGCYSASIVMKPFDLDNAKRSGIIVFGDGADYTKEFVIKCAADKKAKIQIDGGGEIDGFGGESVFTVYTPVDMGKYKLRLLWNTGYGYREFGERDGVKVEKVIAGASVLAAHEQTKNKIVCEKYISGDGIGRMINVYVVPDADSLDFSAGTGGKGFISAGFYQPSFENFSLTRDGNKIGTLGDLYAFGLPEETISFTIKVDKAVAGYQLRCAEDFFDDETEWITYVPTVVTDQDGGKTVTVKLTCKKATLQDIPWGARATKFYCAELDKNGDYVLDGMGWEVWSEWGIQQMENPQNQ